MLAVDLVAHAGIPEFLVLYCADQEGESIPAPEMHVFEIILLCSEFKAVFLTEYPLHLYNKI